MKADIRVDTEERWRQVEEFPMYDVSDRGNVYNTKHHRIMRTTINQFGHVKINLMGHYGQQFTRSVAQMVAEAFVEPPTPLCDQVVVLDGDFTNLGSENLVWRPNWYAYRYTRQLKLVQPLHYRNLPVANITTGDDYDSIIIAGMTEGLLFSEIWRSTYTGDKLFPFKVVFEINHKKV